jgi:uncharacterized membrane protein
MQVVQTRINETARVEAFSDGVFAIAITLLVLELKIPQENHEPGTLYRQLLEQWPMYFAFLTSFVTIGIMWLNHHRLFTLIERCTHSLILLNTLLLLGVTVVPFPTAVVAENLRDPINERTAALLYNGWFLCIAIVFNVLWRYASGGGRLLGATVDQAAVVAQTRQYMFGPLFYALAWGVAWINATLSIAINLALALFFALPPRVKKVGAS